MKLKVFTFLLFFGFLVSNAQNLTEEVALETAREYYSSDNLKVLNVSNKSLKNSEDSDTLSVSPFYIISNAESPGFVIITGNDSNPVVIGYADKANLDGENQIPPQLEYLIGKFNTGDQSKNSAKSSRQYGKKFSTEKMKVLETAPWGQEYPFNSKCPMFGDIQSPTGCVPTAIGIVMKYLNWPLQGKNNRLYNDYEDFQIKNFDFTNFIPQWDLIKDNYEGVELSPEELDAIGNLMREIGRGVATSYGPFDSGTYGEGLNICMRRYFNFGHEVAQSYKENLTDEEWLEKIISEIDENRPLIYSADDGIAAHCFVIDGYNENGMLHVNWGWNGVFNGFFDPDVLNPLGTIYEPLSMITGIGRPGNDDEKWSDVYPIRNQKLLIDFYTSEKVSMPLSRPNVSVSDITGGEPFSFVAPAIMYPPATNVRFGLAVLDKDNNIKEILGETTTNEIPNDNSMNYSLGNAYFNCTAQSTISATDNIRLVVKESSSNEWKLVNDNWDIKAAAEVKGNTPQFVKATWNIEPGHKIFITNYSTLSKAVNQEELEKEFSQLMRGGMYTVYSNASIHEGDTESAIYVNGELKSFCTLNNATFKDGAFYSLIADVDDFDVKVITLHTDAGESREINLEREGALADYLASDNCNYVVDLTLSGPGSNEDYSEIRKNMPFLSSLNLSSYLAKDNSIPDNAMVSFPDLSKVILPANVEIIGTNAFAGNFLHGVTIPTTVKSIGDYAFFQADNCIDVVFSQSPTPPELGMYVFGEDLSDKTLYVLPGALEAYSQHPGWSEFGKIIEGENPEVQTYEITIDGIKYKLYPSYGAVVGYNEKDCPEDVTFKTIITYNDREYTVTTIEADAFYGNKKIKKLVIPETISELNYNCFSQCHNLEEVTIKGPVKTLPWQAFNTGFSIHTLNLPPTLETIGQYSLYGLSSLKELRLPASLKSIDLNGLGNMKSLERIIFEGENDNFNFVNGTLYTKDWIYLICHTNGNKDITEIVIPEGVVKSYGDPFTGTHIKSITLPKTTMRELPHGFYDPSSMYYAFERLIIPDYLTEIPISSFYLPKHLTLGKGAGNISYQPHGFGDYHIYCKNEVTFNAEDLCYPFRDSWEEENPNKDNLYFYTSLLIPNVNLDYDKLRNNPDYHKNNAVFFHLRVPGAVSAVANGWKESQTDEMWKYNLDKENGILYIGQTIDGIEITNVKVNGKTRAPESPNSYKILFDDPEELNKMEVEVNYIINNVETFTTLYDAAFNSKLPSSEPVYEEDWVEEVNQMQDSIVIIYNISGQMVYAGEREAAPELASGVYIVRSAKGTKKIIVK